MVRPYNEDGKHLGPGSEPGSEPNEPSVRIVGPGEGMAGPFRVAGILPPEVSFFSRIVRVYFSTDVSSRISYVFLRYALIINNKRSYIRLKGPNNGPFFHLDYRNIRNPIHWSRARQPLNMRNILITYDKSLVETIEKNYVEEKETKT